MARSVILEALPILLGEMERKTYKPKNQEEFSFYNQTANELKQNYKKLLLSESYPFQHGIGGCYNPLF